jgi:hypothetical protein
MKVFALALLAILLVLPGVFMFLAAAPSTGTEAGAGAYWEGSIGSPKCKLHLINNYGTEESRGQRPGMGPVDGGWVGMDTCSDTGVALNVCTDNIESEFECVAVGTARSCGGLYCMQ